MALSINTRRDSVASLIKGGRRDAPWFIENVIGAPLWSTQRDIVRAVFGHERARVAAKACHASGKTYVGARIVLAFFYLYPGCKILTTAPTWTGVKKLLWSEISAAYHHMPIPLGGDLLDTELRAGTDWWAMGLSTNEGVKFQGHHGDKVLVVLDEAPGVRPDIWEAIEGIRAGGDVRVLALGNPTIASGPFYDAFGKDRAGWATFTIDAFDTPNLEGVTVDQLRTMDGADLAYAPRPYLATRAWVKEKLLEWGEDSPLWQARVRGQFPAQSPDSLISLAWLERAAVPAGEPQDGALWGGLDVSGPGESETVLTLRRGPAILPGFPVAWTQADPRGEVLAALAPYQHEGVQINVDSIGQGYYMARHLEDHGIVVHDVNVALPASDTEKYANSKAEYYWGLRLRLAASDMAGLLDELTIGQLSGVRYKHNARGQIQIESKDDAARRGVPSPDRAESVMLAFASPIDETPPLVASVATSGGWSPRSGRR